MFDSGCIHSFIAPLIVERLDLKISTLSYPLLIMTAEYTTLGIKNLEFQIHGETYVQDFILYGLRDYDVILKMD